MPPARHPAQAELIAIASLLMATVALSVDVMLPALGTMAAEMGVAEGNRRQGVIVVLFLGLAVGQLLFGPLSDAIGRRPAIAAGAVIFAAGSAVCAVAESFEAMLAGRAVQGFGAAGPRIVTVALIRDRHAGAAMARVMSVIMGIFIVVPVVAPSIGALLLHIMPWRGLFGVLAALCLGGTAWLLLRQPETLAARRGVSWAALRTVLADRRAMAFTLAGGLCYGALMGYIASSQQLFQDVYGVGAAYPVLFGAVAAFISAATLTNARLVRRYAMTRICMVAVALLVMWSLGAMGAMALGGPLPLPAFMGVTCVALFLLGLTYGNFNAIALERLGHVAGLAAAVTASLMTLVGMLVMGAVGAAFDGTAWAILVGYAVCGAVSLALMRRAGE